MGDRATISSEEQIKNKDKIYKLIEDATIAADEFVVDNFAAIVAVANALLERQSLTGDDVRAIVLAIPRTPDGVVTNGD